MTKLFCQFSTKKVSQLDQKLSCSKNALLVLGTHADDKKNIFPKALRTKTFLSFNEHFTKSHNFSTEWGKLTTLMHHSSVMTPHEHLASIGLGTTTDFHAQNLLKIGAKIAKLIQSQKIENSDLYIDSFFKGALSKKSKDSFHDFAGRELLCDLPHLEKTCELICEGIALGFYDFKTFKSESAKNESFPNIRILSQKLDDKKLKTIVANAQIKALSVYLCRDLQTTPGNYMEPKHLAKCAQDLAKKRKKLSVLIKDEKKLKSEGWGGILAVGKGSYAPPRFIQIEYNKSNKKVPHIVLVGKGVTFDTGGVSLKPGKGMEAMKMDMSGAATVMSVMSAIHDLDLPIRVTTLVGAAENMCSDRATKPGDIYTSYSGKTVEVLNTDAEGRLVLADCLTYAAKLKPDCVIDFATLTGACVVALGGEASALITNHHKYLGQFKKSGQNVGEKSWELPLYKEYEDDMKSDIADIQNMSRTARAAGTCKAAAFLKYFVDGQYPWIHVDIAGTAMSPKSQGDHCLSYAGTGVPVRTVIDFVENFKK